MKGGVALSLGNQSFLRLSVEESVWFQRGQEVEELVSISLDPNITIQENDQYVIIRGTLDMAGEYKCQSETADVGSRLTATRKWVNSVEEREEGICEFSHQFPVEFHIPTNRVRELSEIEVEIETFDYLLPERSCLKLSAELNILGLYGEEIAVKRQEDNEELPSGSGEAEEELNNLYDTLDQKEEVQLRLDIKEDVVEEVQFRHDFENEEEVQLSDDTEDESDYTPFEVEARKEESPFAEPTFTESSSYQPTVPEIHFAAFRSEVTNVQPEPIEEAQLAKEAKDTEEAEEAHEAVPFLAQQGEEVVENDIVQAIPVEESPELPQLVDKGVKKKPGHKKNMSISEFLARKETEDHTRLKVCIVQNGESVETLAERYQVTIQQLLKVNQLELNKDVYEGQVLYVPQLSVKK